MKILILALLSISTYASISIEGAYIRMLPKSAKNTAAFMIIKNSSDEAYTLKSVKSDLSKKVEIHTMVTENGMMKMREIKQIIVPAKGQVELKPGGKHIMFMGLKRELKLDEDVELQLVFDKRVEVTLKAPIQKR